MSVKMSKTLPGSIHQVQLTADIQGKSDLVLMPNALVNSRNTD